jgi:hypothetical protein
MGHIALASAFLVGIFICQCAGAYILARRNVEFW